MLHGRDERPVDLDICIVPVQPWGCGTEDKLGRWLEEDERQGTAG